MSQKSPEQKSLGLSVYLGVAKYASPLTKRREDKAHAAKESASIRIAERHGQASCERPDTLLIWMHAENLADCLPMFELTGRIRQSLPDAAFLITTSEKVPDLLIDARLPDTVLHQYAPYDTPPSVSAFLDHWRPDICLWSEHKLSPVLLKAAAESGVPLVYVNAALSPKAFKRLRWMPGVATPLLKSFKAILAIDETAAAQFRKLGALPESVSLTGALSEGSAPLSCDEDERVRVAKLLHGRPVWFASHVHPEEEKLILRTHRAASRVTHRLITIISPQSFSQVTGLVERLSSNELSVARRSDPESLNAMTDVLIADVPDELGLWYRVASVSFIGGSLSVSGGQNPYEAAALGSAIIHGPNVENFADSYFRLAEAGAAVEVLSVDSLAEAVSECLAPDKAAEMAHSA